MIRSVPRLRALLAVFGLLAATALPHASRAAGPVPHPRPEWGGAPSCYATAQGATACNADPTIDPDALCNDGTVPAFWIRPGSGSGATTWVFWFQGGQLCYDPYTCSGRASATPGLVSSNGFVPQAGAGLLSSSAKENPLLSNANVVLMGYCSSDTWVGVRLPAHPTVPPTAGFDAADPTTWYFEGHAIALADLRSVLELYPSVWSATTIVIGGSSAGGVGATDNVNAMLPLLPTLPPGHMLFVDDAGFTLDVGQYEATGYPAPYDYPYHPNAYENDFQAWLSFWNGSGDVSCLFSDPSGGVACYDTASVLDGGYVRLPSFVAESLLDTAQQTDQVCPEYAPKSCKLSPAPSSMEGVYETWFGTRMASAVQAKGTSAAFTAYSPDVPEHVILADDFAFVYPSAFGSVQGTAQAAFDAWYASPLSPRTVMIGTGPGVSYPPEPPPKGQGGYVPLRLRH